ncbi:MAG: hypothetical protein J0L73_12035 [Verrucomicrobia bacterium]|nr:hypothetical protein [Verrucomicrobiota bacterium]
MAPQHPPQAATVAATGRHVVLIGNGMVIHRLCLASKAGDGTGGKPRLAAGSQRTAADPFNS